MSQTEVQLIKADAVQTADIANSAVTDAKISALTSSKLTGALPAISGAALTNLPAGGKFASYAVIADQKSQGTAGGTPPNTTAYNTRDLNTILTDPDSIVSVSSNQFTLQAGTYLISASAPAYQAQRNQILIYNVTDSTVVAVGTGEYVDSSENVQTRSFAKNKTTISGAKVFEIRHRVGNADPTYGFGVDTNGGQAEIYTIVEIFKEA